MSGVLKRSIEQWPNQMDVSELKENSDHNICELHIGKQQREQVGIQVPTIFNLQSKPCYYNAMLPNIYKKYINLTHFSFLG